MTKTHVRPNASFLLAGEPSGDVHRRSSDAGHAHESRRPTRLQFFGVGGPRMQAQGLESLFPMEELSLMGFAEVLPHVPKLLRRLSQTRKEIKRQRPAMALTIDSPSFSLRLQQQLDGRSLRRVHYVAPQVWAWRQGRAATLGAKIDHLLALLPFEPRFFQRHGLACSFVGHPIIEEAGREGDGALFRSATSCRMTRRSSASCPAAASPRSKSICRCCRKRPIVWRSASQGCG